MFKSKNKISYSTRGRTIEQNNSGRKLAPKSLKSNSKNNFTTKKSSYNSKKV